MSNLSTCSLGNVADGRTKRITNRFPKISPLASGDAMRHPNGTIEL